MPEPVAKPNILKGDTVVLRRGREKGKRGTVKAVFPKDGTATVEGLNVVKRHSKQGTDGAKSAGIFEKEAPIPLSALQVIDPKTDLPTRVRRIRKDNGETVRVAVRSGEEFLAPAKGR
ncbi:MAG: 50S ribosomal protein L24 [Candidatus Eremiobacteraeota bacterium]|nr:50S ribosomal protein L24 [Candidatus Eremiobacteraeota bacterium]